MDKNNGWCSTILLDHMFLIYADNEPVNQYRTKSSNCIEPVKVCSLCNLLWLVVFRMQADGSDRKVVINTAVDTPTALAYDWVHGILYWADSGQRHGKAKIEAVDVGNGHRHVLFSSPDVDSPRVLVVDPRPDQG